MQSAPDSAPTPLQRHLKQIGLFAAGTGLMVASIAISRRAVIRRKREAFPRFYQSNPYIPKGDDSDRYSIALSALNLATLNVISFGALLVGGIGWAFDLSHPEELRKRSKAALQRPGSTNPEDEKEMEGMMNSLMAKLGMEFPAEKNEGEATTTPVK